MESKQEDSTSPVIRFQSLSLENNLAKCFDALEALRRQKEIAPHLASEIEIEMILIQDHIELELKQPSYPSTNAFFDRNAQKTSLVNVNNNVTTTQQSTSKSEKIEKVSLSGNENTIDSPTLWIIRDSNQNLLNVACTGEFRITNAKTVQNIDVAKCNCTLSKDQLLRFGVAPWNSFSEFWFSISFTRGFRYCLDASEICLNGYGLPSDSLYPVDFSFVPGKLLLVAWKIETTWWEHSTVSGYLVLSIMF